MQVPKDYYSIGAYITILGQGLIVAFDNDLNGTLLWSERHSLVTRAALTYGLNKAPLWADGSFPLD